MTSDLLVPRPRTGVEDNPTPLLRTGPTPAQEVATGARGLRWMLAAELVAVAAMMSFAAALTGASAVLAVGMGALVLAITYVPGRDVIRPGLPTAERVLRDMAIPCSGAGFAGALGWLDQHGLAAAMAVAVAGGATTMVAAGLRHFLVTDVRVVVVGAAAAVAEAFAWSAEDRRVRLVGTLVVDEERPGPASAREGGRAEDRYASAGDPRALLAQFRPDLVLVVPGPGVDAECIRRIGWALEGTGAGLAVQSGMDGIAPHRIQHTRLAGLGVMQVRSSRPTCVVRAAKTVVDRLVASVLLVLFGPLLAALAVLVRATSPGPAIFRQVRVGRDGEHFTMYKLRTMRQDAEELKASLMDSNEGNGLLFKKTDDPRVTRVGRILRKYSLDELPQLINVAKGDMSLVGPRPALPEEVAQYTSLERRRLVVRPGMTGAWQVSGRSTLGRDESVRLDVDYADNYRLVDDVVIGLRTIDAVVHPKGAW